MFDLISVVNGVVILSRIEDLTSGLPTIRSEPCSSFPQVPFLDASEEGSGTVGRPRSPAETS